MEALKEWRHFELGWVTIVPRGVAIEVGATVAVKARAFGTWSLSAARVVYVIDESRRFGFAYGTLPDHVECGEERFLIEWLPDDSVWYDILAFSKPRHPLVQLSSPLARMLQKRFARESLARMKSLASGLTQMNTSSSIVHELVFHGIAQPSNSTLFLQFVVNSRFTFCAIIAPAEQSHADRQQQPLRSPRPRSLLQRPHHRPTQKTISQRLRHLMLKS